jgi:hypothetical protein
MRFLGVLCLLAEDVFYTLGSGHSREKAVSRKDGKRAKEERKEERKWYLLPFIQRVCGSIWTKPQGGIV